MLDHVLFGLLALFSARSQPRSFEVQNLAHISSN
jgi:hypothetical protein